MKYAGILIYIINIIGLLLSFLISPYEFPEDKEMGSVDSDTVLVLFLIFGFLATINFLFILWKLLAEKTKILKWKGDFLILIFFLFSFIEVIRMIWFMKMEGN
ncbi:MAG: hypothetical protein QM564_12590 [Bergeyella sp.]